MRYIMLLFLCTFRALAAVSLDNMMSEAEQKKTGVQNLTDQEKKELENWIDQNFTTKDKHPKPLVYLSENINNGAQIKMSDGSLYEIAPADRNQTSLWIAPFAAKIEESGDLQYPVKITNTITGVSVRAKRVPS